MKGISFIKIILSGVVFVLVLLASIFWSTLWQHSSNSNVALAEDSFTVYGIVDFQNWKNPYEIKAVDGYIVELFFGPTSTLITGITATDGSYSLTSPVCPTPEQEGYSLRLHLEWSEDVNGRMDWVYVKDSDEQDRYIDSTFVYEIYPGYHEFNWRNYRSEYWDIPALWTSKGLRNARTAAFDQPGGIEKVQSITAVWTNGKNVSYYKYMSFYDINNWNYFFPGSYPTIQLQTYGPDQSIDDPWTFYDTVLHESGHWIMSKLYSDANSSEYQPWTINEYIVALGFDFAHSTGERTSAPVAWGEGWSDFWALYVQGNDKIPPSIFGWNLEEQTYSLNIDVIGENHPWGLYGDEVEGWITGALWDLYDTANDTGSYWFDQYQGNFTDIWNTLKEDPGGNPGTKKAYQCSFAEFWEKWQALYPATIENARRAIYQNTILYGDTFIKANFKLIPTLYNNYAVVNLAVEKTWDIQDAQGWVNAPDGILRYQVQANKQSGLDIQGLTSDPPSNPQDEATSQFQKPTASILLPTEIYCWGAEARSDCGPWPNPPSGQPLVLSTIWPYLNGSKNTSYQLRVDFTELVIRADGENIISSSDAVPDYVTITLRRGNAKPDTAVNITDALFIAQYLAGIRDISTLNTVNAASPKLENTLGFYGLGPDMPISSVKGEKINVTDALYIAQMLAGIRDDTYTWITANPAFVELPQVTVPSGSGQISLKAGGLSDFPSGLGDYDVEISYLPSVIQITGISGGDYPFNGTPTYKIDNVAGKLTLNSYQTSQHPISDMIIANINFNAVGASGSSTNLIITIKSLETNAPHPVEISPRVTHNGKITIQ